MSSIPSLPTTTQHTDATNSNRQTHGVLVVSVRSVCRSDESSLSKLFTSDTDLVSGHLLEHMPARVAPAPTPEDGLPAGWRSAVDGDGKTYYLNDATCTTTYQDPRLEPSSSAVAGAAVAVVPVPAATVAVASAATPAAEAEKVDYSVDPDVTKKVL